jgi:hypothetical protein
MSGMQGALLHTRYSSIQNDKYQVSHKYSCFSWWWAYSRPKHVEKINKLNKKNCAPSWLYLQDCTGIDGEQNIKFCHVFRILEESHEDDPVQQTNKITDLVNIFLILFCAICVHIDLDDSLLTLRKNVLPQKLLVPWLVKELPVFYINRFFTALQQRVF